MLHLCEGSAKATNGHMSKTVVNKCVFMKTEGRRDVPRGSLRQIQKRSREEDGQDERRK